MRDDATGKWTSITLAQDQPAPDFLPQIRRFGAHRDRVTGIALVFAGEMPRGIFKGVYDDTSPGRIRIRVELKLAGGPCTCTGRFRGITYCKL